MAFKTGEYMINNQIIAIKDNILSTIGDECEKIILFGSYAYGTPHKDSDYDFYVVLKDGSGNPILAMQKIYEYMCDTNYIPVDILANYKSRFEWRSTQPTLERTIVKKGTVLYERT
jgi:predicted nucleotidyltransferase